MHADALPSRLDETRGSASRIVTPVFLFLAGAVLTAIGAGILLVPHAYFAANGVALGADPSQLSDVRASGGLLAVIGVVVGLGAFARRRAGLALALTALTYGGYGASRLLAIAVDGLPADGLVSAMIVELAVGAAAAVALARRRAQSDRPIAAR